MIIAYDAGNIDFNNNGLAALDEVISCEVTEEKNGDFSLELEYPITDSGKWQYLFENSILKIPCPKGSQLFRIYKKIKNMSSITVSAKHIFYDLLDNFIEDCRPTNLSGSSALNWIFSHLSYGTKFTAYSDISNTASAEYIRKNPVQALISDDDNSFINKWGGEIVRDNYDIKMLGQVGRDRGVKIQYGKNLVGIEEELDLSNVVTRLYPTCSGEDSNDVITVDSNTYTSKYVNSKYINNYPNYKIAEKSYSDIKVDDATTVEQAKAMLLAAAQKEFTDNKIDIPQVTYTINFTDLSQTEEYKDYKSLETVYLYDYVTVKHDKLGMDIQAEVIAYKWDAVFERYNEITLGNYKTDFASSYNKELNTVKQDIVTQKSDLLQAVDNATNLITGNKGGYVVMHKNADGEPYEILIMDTPDINTAKKVWRWNNSGLGYSSNGYSGDYGLAMTIDGAIVATYITTGILNGDLIKVGTITSKDGKLSIDLTNGIMQISGASKWIGSNGSYTMMDGDSFVRYDGTTKQKLFDLYYSQVVTVPANPQGTGGYTSTIVQLPDKFKNKMFYPKVSPKGVSTNFVPSTFGAIGGLDISVGVISYANATVQVSGMFDVYDLMHLPQSYSGNQYLDINLDVYA
ncbi:phage tail protein [Clostridium sp. 19966]|uniref:phage tail spike protein n=1 Tax=Clostridium sp. 19966 TaxID=2768166 RepID=UPI0028DD499A|nr:phage tail spike protein [Clostridium sp. 19966]MDT8717746.1 phage tail protein [Clostridium sp. 19966]